MGKRENETYKASRERFVNELVKTVSELSTLAEDIRAFATGAVGPTQQAYIDKINDNWNGYNFIVAFGHVHRLTDKVKKKDNGALYNPCELCSLSDCCPGSESDKPLCNLMQADTNEYFYDEGELIINKNGNMKVKKWPF